MLDFVTDFYRQPALTPPMTWQDSIPPAAPVFATRVYGNTLRIWWDAVKDQTPVVYNIYRLAPQGPQLIAHHLRTTLYDYSPALPALLHDRYVVVAMDAYGNESPLPPLTDEIRPTHPRFVPLPAAYAPKPNRHVRR